MLNLIDRIIEIDKSARKKVDETDEEIRLILLDAQNQVEGTRKEYKERAESRLKIVEDTYTRFAAEETEGLYARKKEKIDALTRVIAENKERYEKEILSRILGSYYKPSGGNNS